MDYSKKKENLEKINDWCKSLDVSEPIYVDKALFCNNRYYRISVSQIGIGAFGCGKYSSWLHVNDSGDSLTKTKVGTEIICNWQNIKQKILNAVAEYKRREELMENFEV